MKEKPEDFLVEILTEELPPKALLNLARVFSQQIKDRLQKSDLQFADTEFFATPRRIAVLVKNLNSQQPDQEIERKGPATSAAFDANGNPTQACIGFARSVGVTPAELVKIKNPQGEWMGYKQKVKGKSVSELLPEIINQAIAALPIPKRMRWGDGDSLFVRPVHSVLMLYGDQIVESTLFGLKTSRVTYGHRFHAPDAITIPDAATYASLLETEGYVIADFFTRRKKIRKQAVDAVEKKLGKKAQVIFSEDLLDEVTGIVEWPNALCGSFDEEFLNVPEEVLISAMQDHQRYFPVRDATGKLLPNFVTISNILSKDTARVIHGNERVLRARLSDAAFFYETDKKESLLDRCERLRGIIFQAKLGTLYDKAERISKLAKYIAQKTRADVNQAARAGMLAKADLTTNMVGEFPELQGVMGFYYALHDKEPNDVAQAMKEQYLPRFSGDAVAKNPIGQVLAIADRIDTLVGMFSINQIPTGDKDPLGLRRAALGVLRTLIENQIDLDLKDILEFALSNYQTPVENKNTVAQILNFMQERLRAWYQEQEVAADIFASVAALQITNPLDIHKRIQAVKTFKKLNEAEALSIANKRVSNILTKYTEKISAKAINETIFENLAEQELARQLDLKSKKILDLSKLGKYDEVLLQLADLRKPVDDFFDHVMVMVDDKAMRENRILLLSKLRALFLQVADIALLQ